MVKVKIARWNYYIFVVVVEEAKQLKQARTWELRAQQENVVTNKPNLLKFTVDHGPERK